MKKYYKPTMQSYSPLELLESTGPVQTASVNVTIGATAFNTQTPAIYKNINKVETKLAKLNNKIIEVA